MNDELENFEDYTLPEEKVVFVEPESGTVKNYEELSPWDKIVESAKRYSVTISNPKKNCKKCFGRGYTGIALDGNNKVPIACKCIYQNLKK